MGQTMIKRLMTCLQKEKPKERTLQEPDPDKQVTPIQTLFYILARYSSMTSNTTPFSRCSLRSTQTK